MLIHQMRSWAILICLSVLLVSYIPTHADPNPVPIDNNQHWIVEAGQLSISETIPINASPADVVSGRYADTFTPTTKPVVNLMGHEKAIWGHVRLKNTTNRNLEAALVLKYSALDFVDFYTVDSNGDLIVKTGGQIPAIDQTSLPSRFPMGAASIPSGQTSDIYFRIRTDTLAIIPAQVHTVAHLQHVGMRDVLIFSALIGLMLAIAALGIITFFSSKQYAYLWFSSFTFAGALYTLVGSNIGKTYLWPSRSGDDVFFIFVILGIAMASAAMFVARFLNTSENAPRFHTALQVIAGCSLVTCLTTPLPWVIVIPATLVSAGIGPIFILISVFVLWRKRVRGAGLVLVSWLPNQLGITWVFLRGIDVIPYTEFNHFALPLSCALTAIAFTWALHRRAQEAEHNAAHDMLTGLPNRLRLEQVIAEPPPLVRRSVGVMQIDLDGFKAINDVNGHAAGDHVLQEVATRLRELCAPFGMAFRTGGDEFVVLCHRRTRQSDTEALAEKVVTLLAQPIPWRGELLQIGASIGLAFPLEGRETVNIAFEQADAALYKAKRAGKGQVVKCEDLNVPGNDNVREAAG